MAFRGRGGGDRRRSDRVVERPPWNPRTELGKKVAAGQIASYDEILESGKSVLETQIVDTLIPDLKEEVLEVTSTQRMTAYGRKQKMRAVVVLGNQRGYVAVGVGKANEARDAIQEAITDGKKHIVKVTLGCGSWECGCGTPHSIPQKAFGKSSSTSIEIRPAPKGVGIVAGSISKKVLEFVGVKDCWSFSKGRTRNVLNMILATISALETLNHLKSGAEMLKVEPKKPQAPAAEVQEGIQVESAPATEAPAASGPENAPTDAPADTPA